MDAPRPPLSRFALPLLALLAALAAAWLLSAPGALSRLVPLRAPLACAALLLLLPRLARGPLRSALGNLFHLRRAWQVALAGVAAAVAGGAAVRAFAVALANLDCRLALPEADCRPETLGTLPGLPPLAQAVLAALLTLPVAVELVRRAPRGVALRGLAAAALVAAGLYAAWTALALALGGIPASWLGPLLRVEGLAAGYVYGRGPDAVIEGAHLEQLAFLLVVAVAYASSARWAAPRSGRQVPALFFLLALLALACLAWAGAAFLLDRWRIPALLPFALIAAGGYALFRVEHVYRAPRLEPSARPGTPGGDDDLEAVAARMARAARGPGAAPGTLVAVAAAGGGIQAAAWTARVLAGLQEELGDGFARAVGLASGASGGSVGLMHLLDRSGPDGAPPAAERDAMVAAASRNGLDAVGWGLAYPDLARLVGLPWLVPEHVDRGWALEEDWRACLARPDERMSGWAERARAGEVPIAALNAVIVEDGRPLLLCPFDLHAGPGVAWIGSLLPGRDPLVATAARLSATFPWVTPIARDPAGGPGLHVADGGYFDNFGVHALASWLDRRVLPRAAELGVRRVLVVEIRAFPDSAPAAPARETGVRPPGRPVSGVAGWRMQAFGPTLAMFSTRRSSQVVRNAARLDLLAERWAGEVPLERFEIVFPDGLNAAEFDDGSGRYAPPLSWKLSRAQEAALAEGWRRVARADPRMAALRAAWSRAVGDAAPPPAPPPAPPSPDTGGGAGGGAGEG